MSPVFQIRIFPFIAFTICYLAWQGARAFPIPTINRQYVPSQCNDLHRCRTIWNIIWSSLATTFSCIWVSVHPNVPHPYIPHPNPPPGIANFLLHRAKFIAHRVKLMVVTLLVPEVVIIWALRQWLAARRIAKLGGFYFYDAKSITEVPFRSS